MQKSCPSLANIRSLASSGEHITIKDGSIFCFTKVDGLIYRKCVSANTQSLVGKLTLIVLAECRNKVFVTLHESTLAGHFGHRKTSLRLNEHFFWPSVTSDVRSFYQSCNVCQRFSPKGRSRKVPLEHMPIVTESFSKVAMDIVGPLSPVSANGFRYILTLIDFTTGFPRVCTA